MQFLLTFGILGMTQSFLSRFGNVSRTFVLTFLDVLSTSFRTLSDLFATCFERFPIVFAEGGETAKKSDETPQVFVLANQIQIRIQTQTQILMQIQTQIKMQRLQIHMTG